MKYPRPARRSFLRLAVFIVAASVSAGLWLAGRAGTHTVTPFRDGTSFGPASRTFSSPAASQTDADFDGYSFWLSKLDEFDGNSVAAEMVKAFLNSDEYRKRFNQP